MRPYLIVLIAIVVLQVAVGSLRFAAGPAAVQGVPTWLALVASLWFGGAGVVVAVTGRWDLRTAPLAGLFLAIASAVSMPLLADATEGGSGGPLPWWLSGALVEAFFPFFLWRFVEQFPRIVRLERGGGWIVGARRLSLWAGLVLFSVNLAHALTPDVIGADRFVPFLLRAPVSGYWLILLAMAIPAPLVVFSRLRFADLEERRRARLFVSGLAIGILPIIVAALLAIVWPAWSAWMEPQGHRAMASVVVYAFLLTIPVTLGYAAAARQVVELRFVVGRAARVILARVTLWTLSVAPWLALVSLLWLGRERPVAELFRSPAVLLLAAVGVIGLLLIATRDRLLAGVERSLLGDGHAPGAALAAMAHQLAVARDGSELAACVHHHATSAIGAEGCRLLLRTEDGGFRPTDPQVRGLDAVSALAALADETPEPISTDLRDRDSWMPWLPEEDCLWIAETDTRLILPVIGPSDDCVALLAYGPLSSGMAFESTHRDAAAAVASSVALALARLGSDASVGREGGAMPSDEPAGECPACGRLAPSRDDRCPCGSELVAAAIPFVVGGKFRLERVLGRGGMGVVYLGLDLTLGRRVALKTLPRMRSGSLLRLRWEARSMASFVHPNLALIFGAETWRGVPVLVVEYLSGGTLAKRLHHDNDPAWVIELGIKLAGALEALHEKGLLHRDVKPANIGFSERLEPKLLDFGLVHILEQSIVDAGEVFDVHDEQSGPGNLTRTDHIVGTPRYLSPEVVQGLPPSPEQDLWGLNVVLWEALAGCHPLHDLSVDDALERIRKWHLPDIRSVRPDCPEAVAEQLARGLHRRSGARPATARQLCDELRAVRAELDRSACR